MLDTTIDNVQEVKELNVTETAETKKTLEYGREECILAVLAAVFAVIYVRYVVFAMTGLVSTLLYIALITTGIIYLRKKGHAFSAFNKALAAVLYVFSTVFTVTDNGFIKLLNAVFLFVSGAYMVYSVCTGKNDVEKYLPYALKDSVLKYPFSKIEAQSNITSDRLKRSDAGTVLKYVIGGLILTIPVTFIVFCLLVSADDHMKDMMNFLCEKLDTKYIWMWVLQLIIAVPCSMYLFGMFYANAHKTVEEENYSLKRDFASGLNNLMFYTAATPLLILYVIFFISQASYFLSAFIGRLPEGFSYAEYARKGFFELCWVAVINMGVIVLMNYYAKNRGEYKPFALKVYTFTLSLFTLFIIADALCKMIMYIDAYGLTLKRVYTTWFMLLCAFIFMTVIIKQFKPQLRIARCISIGFTLFFAVLCFSRPEAVITNYNADFYHTTEMSEYDICEVKQMSDDALCAAVRKGILSADKAKEISEKRHSEYVTDKLNVSTMILQLQ